MKLKSAEKTDRNTPGISHIARDDSTCFRHIFYKKCKILYISHLRQKICLFWVSQYRKQEKNAPRPLVEMTLAKMDVLWNEAKKRGGH
jgi:hypothetical protein